MILVPIKNLEGAKQRLSPVLEAEERRALAAAMMEDVLETLASWRARPPVAVVTSDPQAIALAHHYGFEIIPEPENRSETDAIALATRVVAERGWTLVIPADIPLVEAAELQNIVDAAPETGSVLVPSADGRGSNAVLRRPAALFPLRFGDDSFVPHRRAAEATGTPVVVLELPGIGLDVDRPGDLAELLARDGDRRSQRLLRAWNIAERMAAARTA